MQSCDEFGHQVPDLQADLRQAVPGMKAMLSPGDPAVLHG